MRFVFIYFPLKHEKGGIPHREHNTLISAAPVSVNRLGEDDARCVCVCVSVRDSVLICAQHVRVTLSSCGVFYFWQEILGGKASLRVLVYLFPLRLRLPNVPCSH